MLKVWRWMVDTETNLRTSRIKTEKHANFRLTINIWNTNWLVFLVQNTKDYNHVSKLYKVSLSNSCFDHFYVKNIIGCKKTPQF